MEILVTYKEILHLVKKFTDVDLSNVQIVNKNRRTIEIKYQISVFVPTISVTISIDRVTEQLLCISYDCTAAASMIISGVVSFLQSKIPAGVKVDTTSKKVYVYLDVINGLEKVLQYFTPKDIQCETNMIHVSAELK